MIYISSNDNMRLIKLFIIIIETTITITKQNPFIKLNMNNNNNIIIIDVFIRNIWQLKMDFLQTPSLFLPPFYPTTRNLFTLNAH